MSRTQLNTKHALLFHPTGSKKKTRKKYIECQWKLFGKYMCLPHDSASTFVFTCSIRYVGSSTYRMALSLLSANERWDIVSCDRLWCVADDLSLHFPPPCKANAGKWKKTNKWRRPSSVGWFMTTKWAVQKHWRRFVFHLTERAAPVYQEKHKKKEIENRNKRQRGGVLLCVVCS